MKDGEINVRIMGVNPHMMNDAQVVSPKHSRLASALLDA